MEISNLLDAEFKSLVIRMLKKLGEEQINAERTSTGSKRTWIP